MGNSTNQAGSRGVQVDADWRDRRPGYYLQGCPAWWDANKIPEQVAAQIKRLASFYEDRNGLLLYGPPGVGKTAVAIGLGVADGVEGKYSVFHDFDELMNRVRATWRRDAAETTADIMEHLVAPDTLVLDDIGKAVDAKATETLSMIINSRINAGRPTIATTNCQLDTTTGAEAFAKACDGRVLERFTGCDVNAATWGKNLRRENG